MYASALNFIHTFDAVVTFNDTGERKPHPAPFKAILNKLNVKPEETLMIGDWAERDILGAKNAGMKTAFAKYGDTFNTQDHGADFELNDISELVGIINEENHL